MQLFVHLRCPLKRNDYYPKTDYFEAVFFQDINTMQNSLLPIAYCLMMQVLFNLDITNA